MANDDNIIENDVVKISPDLTGFRKKLQADLKAQTAGVKAEIPIDFEFKTDPKQSALNYVAGLRAQSIKDQLKQVRNGAEQVEKAQSQAFDAELKRVRSHGEDLQKAETQAHAGDAKRGVARVRSVSEIVAQAENQAHTADKARAASRVRDLSETIEKAQQQAGQLEVVRQTRRVRSTAEAVAQAEDQAHSADKARALSRVRDLDEVVDKAQEQATQADIVRNSRRVRTVSEAVQAAQDAATKQEGNRLRSASEAAEKTYSDAVVADRARTLARVRNVEEASDAVHEKALTENASRDLQRVRTAEEALTAAHIDAERLMTRELQKEYAKQEADDKSRRQQLSKAFERPQLIALGQEGIKPINLLYAAAIAATPALFAMASSAVQASTSLAALGTGAYAGVAGIVGLTIGLKGLTDILALRKSVQSEQTAAAANATKTNDALTASIEAQQNARDALADAQDNELSTQQAINTARQQAIRDLVDLKQKVLDLQNQEKGDQLTVEEKKIKQKEVDRNYFATPLEKRRAAQDVADAITTRADTKLSLKENTSDLKTSVKAGIAGSTPVKQAVAAHKTAVRTVTRDRTALDKATSAVTVAKAGGTVSTAQANLNEQLKEHSQAFRDLYAWIDKNDGVLKTFRNRIEQAIYPGFTTFLGDIFSGSKNSASTMELLVQGVEGVSGAISDTVKQAGTLAKTPWFKAQIKTLNKASTTGTRKLGDAAVTLVKPLLTITTAASPLFVKFTGYIDKLAHKFSDFIDKAAKNGSLKKWFHDAAGQASSWFDIVKNLFTFLKNLFSLSLPTGDSLVQRFADFTKQLADWSGSDSGQKQIKKFFDFFKDLNYGQVAQIVGSAVEFFGAYKAVAFLAGGNIITQFLGAALTFVTSNPKLSIELFKSMTAVLNAIAGPIAAHPEAAAAVLAIFAAARTAKKLDIGIKLPGVDNLKNYLTSKFKPLEKLFGGETSVATMTVRAGVVNISGAEIGGAGSTGLLGTTEKGAKGASKAGALGELAVTGLTVAGGVVAASMVVDTILGGKSGTALDGFKSLAMGPESYSKWSKENAPAFKHFFSMTLPDWITAGGTRGWSSFKDAFYNTFGNKAGHFFSIDLPNAINLGSTGSGGWAGLATNLGKFFSETWPDSISGQKGGGWAAVGTKLKNDALNWIGVPTIEGIWDGIVSKTKWLLDKLSGWASSFWKWLRGLFGVHSPSTFTIEIGMQLIAGLWQGFVDKWNAVEKGALKWIDSNILSPLSTAFGDVGEAIKAAFVAPFDTLTSTLAAPIKKAFSWLNTYLIGPLNTLLSAIGITGIPPITIAATTATTNIGAAINAGASVVKAATGNSQIGKTIVRADGGIVPGSSPHAKADNIPAMLTANEYVQPVSAVQKYGVGFMDAVRTGRYAAGGLVSKLPGASLVPKIIKGALSSVGSLTDLAAGIAGRVLGTSSGGSVIGDASVEQIAYQTATAMGASAKQLLALFEAGIVESGFKNLTGGDRDSVGFLQQRPSQGWGTVAQIENPAYAARKFLQAAMAVKGQDKLTAGQLAQAVQRSAYPLRYDQHQADAQAILNSLTGAVSNVATGATAPLFGAWPASPAVDHGHDSGVWRKIIQYVAPTGLDRHMYGTLYQNRRTDNGNWSWHSDGRAVDFGGYNQDKLAQFFMARRPSVLELIHRSETADYGIKRGQPHDMGHEFGLHKNHVHVAMAGGGLVQKTYDSGGGLPPGYTLAYNGTGRTETVRTARQEADLNTNNPMRLDRRDIVLIATHLGAVLNGQQISMDGRKVAEVTNRYNYLPAGV